MLWHNLVYALEITCTSAPQRQDWLFRLTSLCMKQVHYGCRMPMAIRPAMTENSRLLSGAAKAGLQGGARRLAWLLGAFVVALECCTLGIGYPPQGLEETSPKAAPADLNGSKKMHWCVLSC